MSCGLCFSGCKEWLHPAKKTLERERVLGMGERACTCGGCDTDGFGLDAGSESREVDNEIITRA